MSSLEPPTNPPSVSDADLADLVAYDNGSLDAPARTRVDARLAGDDEYAAVLASTRRIRRITTSIDERPPDFASLVGPWNTPTKTEPTTTEPVGPEPPAAFPPPAAAVPAARSPLQPPARRSPAVPLLAAAAVAVLFVGALVLVAGRASNDQADQVVQPSAAVPTTDPAGSATEPNVLDVEPRRALRRASAATVDASSVRLTFGGSGVLSFDGEVLDEPGTRPEVVIDIGGDGEIVFASAPDGETASRIRTEFVGVSGPETARPPLTIVETVRVDGRIFRSSDGLQFEETDSADEEPGALAALIGRPDLLARLDDLAIGEIDDLGTEQIDGIDHRHLRFVASDEVFDADITPPATIDVWVSSIDETVRRYVLTVDGPLEVDDIPDAEVFFEFVTDVTETGDDITIEVPE